MGASSRDHDLDSRPVYGSEFLGSTLGSVNLKAQTAPFYFTWTAESREVMFESREQDFFDAKSKLIAGD